MAGRLPLALAAALAAGLPGGLAAAGSLQVVGSTTVAPLVVEAADALRAERGLEIVVDTQGGSSGGISALAAGRARVAMSSRPLTDDDRRRYPRVRFEAVEIGSDAVAIVVAADVWQGGVRSISRDEMRAVFEGRATHWRELGGPDRRIVLFDKEPGRGTWEVFARWLYGSPEAVPLVSHLEVGSNEEGRTKVGATRGAMSQLSAAWADGEKVFALAVRGDDGVAVAPTPENVAAGRYPLARPLLLVTDGPPAPDARALIDFVRGPRGRELVAKHGYLPPPAASGSGGGGAGR